MEWEYHPTRTSEVRRKAEEEVAQMRIVVKEAQEDSRKLGGYIQEWKIKVEKSRNNTAKSR